MRVRYGGRQKGTARRHRLPAPPPAPLMAEPSRPKRAAGRALLAWTSPKRVPPRNQWPLCHEWPNPSRPGGAVPTSNPEGLSRASPSSLAFMSPPCENKHMEYPLASGPAGVVCAHRRLSRCECRRGGIRRHRADYARQGGQLGAQELHLAHDLRTGLLRHRNDVDERLALRHCAFRRRGVSRFAAADRT